ncbi:hypothetical protein Y032_0552g3335 [Ancylostoma ceylanicum]|uniref:Uncharacterized protein n=1 Tax=Ancylostoma ceylanicum TaxID=53326 RepID=A0A016WPW7_9BILA|nr:hypothetical protein Y032_0552g3335 [Ancylostoma ceylanicum]
MPVALPRHRKARGATAPLDQESNSGQQAMECSLIITLAFQLTLNVMNTFPENLDSPLQRRFQSGASWKINRRD